MSEPTGGYPSSARRVSELRPPRPSETFAATYRIEPTAIRDGDYISVPRQALANLLRRVDPGGFLSPDLEVNWDRDGRLVERHR